MSGEDCIIVENDAVNCFDRILPNISELAFLRLGLAAGIIGFYLSFLEAARNHIIVDEKPSKRTYVNSKVTPIMGSGQGKCWALPSWFTISNIILTGLSKNQPGIFLVSPDGNTKDFRAAEASVDDVRQGVNTAGLEKYNREHKKNLDIGQATNQASQEFERYLTLKGGRLALD